MFNSTVLEVAVGMVFCFAAIALIVSSIYEAIASIFGLRSKTLLTGVKALLNDDTFSDLARGIYNHALINPRASGTAETENDLINLPSYIDAKDFSTAFLDCIQSVPGDFTKLGDDIEAISDPQLKTLLKGFYVHAQGDAVVMHQKLATWFDGSMDRVSGAYKRWSQLWCFLIGLVIAALFNIDTFHVFSTLWAHPSLVASLDTVGMEHTSDAMNRLVALPVGWETFPPEFGQALFIQLVGWLVTASAALFGAPFWFDILQQILKIRVRGTGSKPGAIPTT
jgi:hypothetical protein